MFNKLPKYVRIVYFCSVDKFKSQLDKHLRNIVEIPSQHGWWRLFEWRLLCGRPGCQLDATEQPQVTQVSNMIYSFFVNINQLLYPTGDAVLVILLIIPRFKNIYYFIFIQ